MRNFALALKLQLNCVHFFFITPQLTVLCGLVQASPFKIEGYSLGFGYSLLAGLLMAAPLICIPAFIFFALYKVSIFELVSHKMKLNFRTFFPFLILVVFKNQGTNAPFTEFSLNFEDPKRMTRASQDLRQIRPHNPLLTLCGSVIFKAQEQTKESEEIRNEKLMEDSSKV